MSAKPQPMAGQSDAADDLIAELAKLMAQDAKSDRPVEAPFPAFSVRIPGEAAPPPAATPTPRFDFDRTVALGTERSTTPAARVAVPSPNTAPSAAAAPSTPPAKPAPEAPEPFKFDFDLSSSAPQTAAPAPGPAPSTPAPPPAATVAPADHDSIADLIAAEFANEPAPVPEASIAAAPEPIAATPVRTAPKAGPGWTPAAVAPNLGGEDKPARAPLRPLNLQPAARSEPDRFQVPPVFGVGSKPAAVEPSVSPVAATPAPSVRQPAPPVAAAPVAQPQDDGLGSDPIDEIEHLIGRAMRVEFDKPVEPVVAEPLPAPTASPTLRSLATPVAVAPAAARASAPRTLSGADEAILAAAAATGAEIGWVETPDADEPAFETMAAPPRARRSLGLSRAVAGPLVAITLLLAAGFGLYWVLGMGGGDAGPAPLLTADTTPVKETPAVQPDAAETQQSVVFNEINGVVPGAEEQLVSRDQADVNEVTQVPPTTDLSEEGLANRKVRTVTVRPDGTIVSGEQSVAGSTILPVDRPNVPAVPGAETASPELLASAEPAAVVPDATATTEPVAVPETPVAPSVTPVTPGSTVPAVDTAGNPLAGKTAVVPLQRPSGLQATAPTASAGSPVTAVVDTPATTGGNLLPPPPATSTLGALPTAQPAAAQPSATQSTASIPGAVEVEALPNSAPAYAQLASLRSEEEARQAAQSLVTRFGPLFGGANMEVQRVDLGARGIYYRVRVPAQSVQAAGNICTNVVAAGGDCVPM